MTEPENVLADAGPAEEAEGLAAETCVEAGDAGAVSLDLSVTTREALLFITEKYKCPAKCPYCTAQITKWPETGDNFDRLESHLDALYEAGIRFEYLSISGNGEPSCYSRKEMEAWMKVLKKYEAKGLFGYIRFHTCGKIFFSKDKWEACKDCVFEVTRPAVDDDENFSITSAAPYMHTERFQQSKVHVNIVLLKEREEQIVEDIMAYFERYPNIQTVGLKLLNRNTRDFDDVSAPESQWVLQHSLQAEASDEIIALMNRHFRLKSPYNPSTDRIMWSTEDGRTIDFYARRIRYGKDNLIVHCGDLKNYDLDKVAMSVKYYAMSALRSLNETIGKLRDPESGCPSDISRPASKTTDYLGREIREMGASEDDYERSKEMGDVFFNLFFLAQQLGLSTQEMVDNIEVMEISASVYDDVVAIIEDIDQRSNELNVDDLSKLLNTLITLCEARDINVPLAIKRVVKKMVYRHPHVFDKPKHIDLDESNKIWVKMKKREKMEENRSLDIDFEKRGGRVPVVLKSLSGRVVSLTDIDSEGLTQVLDSKKFDGVDVREMLVDCDQDALTITGPFKSSEGGFAKIPDISALGELESDPDKVYTVAIQDKNSNQILIVGYANLMAITETLETGNATLWSTSRNELWTKGKGSGNVLSETEVSFCANNNTFLYRVNPAPRGACHTINLDLEERESCFYRAVDLGNGQNQLTFLEE